MSNPFASIKGGRLPQIPMIAIDRFGKVIEPGHLVLFHAGEDLIFEVVSTGPVLNPSIQGGRAMQVILRAEFPVQFQPGMPNRGMVICGESQARIQARAGSNGQPEAQKMPAPDQPQGPQIVLTAAPEGGLPAGVCGKCGDEGPLGERCTECGTDTYQTETPTLGDA